MVKANEQTLLSTYKIVADSTGAWMVPILFNGLFMVDLQNGNLTWCGKTPGEEDFKAFLYQDYCLVNKKIVLAPRLANSISIYDCLEGEFITIDYDESRYKKNGNVCEAFSYRNHAYIIGIKHTNSIVRMNPETLCLEELNEREVTNKMTSYGRRSCIKNSHLYVPVKPNRIMIIDLNAFSIERIITVNDMDGIIDILFPYMDSVAALSSAGDIFEINGLNSNKINFEASQKVIRFYCGYFQYKGCTVVQPVSSDFPRIIIDNEKGVVYEKNVPGERVYQTIELNGQVYELVHDTNKEEVFLRIDSKINRFHIGNRALSYKLFEDFGLIKEVYKEGSNIGINFLINGLLE